MKYCVVKDTTKVIDGSDNPLEVMLQNAQNIGFTELEVEILTEEEYQARVELEPKPIAEPTDMEIQQEVINTLGQELAMLKIQFMMGGM